MTTHYIHKIPAFGLLLVIIINGPLLFGQAPRPFPVGLPPCLEDDFRQLEILYDVTHGDDWTSHTNWFTANMASWQGIRLTAMGCDIDSIGLVSNHLVGTLPNLNLPHLKRLFLHNNQLVGNIPNFNLTGLASLQLSRNQFTGNIPNFNLPYLGYLQLSYNQLTGSIPNFDSTRLNWLSLGFNQFTGNIPNFNLANLTTLQLSNNQLTGALPPFNQCPLLYNLQIDNNRFSFDKLIRLVTLRTWNTFTYAPQDSFHIDTTHTAYRSSTLRISLNIAQQDSNTVFNWYKGTYFIRSTQNNAFLDLERLVPADAGTYTCKVTNSAAPQLTLFSKNIRVNVLTTTIVQGGTRTDLQCGDRPYKLPSGRYVNTFGTHYDTLRHTDATNDSAYVVILRSDSSCHCQDSVALAGMYHTSGGFPQNWNLNLPMTTWIGLTFDNNGCVVGWRDTRPDSLVCMTLNDSASLRPDFGIWELVNGTKKWFRNGTWVDTYTGNPLDINQFSQADTGIYVCRIDLNVGQFALIPTLRSVVTRAYQVRLCCTTTVVQRDAIIQAGTCMDWFGIARCSTGIYTYSTINPNTGCETIQRLNLRVDTCDIAVRLSQVGTILSALVTSSRPIVNYRWSNEIRDTHRITIQNSGTYRVTVTDRLGCKDSGSINAVINRLKFKMDSAQITCAGNHAAYTTILFGQSTSNAEGYVAHIHFDTTKVRPDTVINHRYKYRMPDTTNCRIYQSVLGNELILTFLPIGGQLIQANVGDTLIRISWVAISREVSTSPILLSGFMDESLQATGSVTTYLLNGQLKISGSGSVLGTHLNAPGQFHATIPAILPTIVSNGTVGNMTRIGNLNSVGIDVSSLRFGNYLGFYRQSLPDFGIPDVGNFDAYLIHRLIVGDTILTAHQLIKADVDGSGDITTADLGRILYRANHQISGLAQANNSLHPRDTMSWRTYPVTNEPAFNAANMRYVDLNGIVRYRIPKIDTIIRMNDIYLNRCDTLAQFFMHAQLGNIHGNPSGPRRSPLSSQIIFGLTARKDSNNVWMIPIYAKECSIQGLDIQMDGFNMEILGVELAHANLTMSPPFINNANKVSVFGCYTTGNPVATDNPIAYLRARVQTNQLQPAHIGAFKAYLNGQLISGIISDSREIPLLASIKVYPNPSTGLFTIESSEKLGTIRVYDALGRMIKTMETIENQLNIDLTDYSDGLYMVKIGQQVYKISKQ
jgi:Secretion system C-terminal sorting domain